MPGSEDVLRRAAFGDAEPPALPLLARRDGPGRERWLAAVVLGGQARYAAAAALLHDLRAHPDPVLASLAGSTLAAHRRQLGGHAAARVLDGAALAALRRPSDGGCPLVGDPDVDVDGVDPDGVDPDGVDFAGAHCDALLGLAADALGLGRTVEARRLLGHAERTARGWRCEVRLWWVHAEVELADSHPDSAVPYAERATRLAREAGAERHAVKSDLVLAAALTAAAREPDRARALVHAASERADRYSLRSLAWPARVLAGSLGVDCGEQVGVLLRSVLRQADPQGRRLAHESVWMPLDEGTAPVG